MGGQREYGAHDYDAAAQVLAQRHIRAIINVHEIVDDIVVGEIIVGRVRRTVEVDAFAAKFANVMDERVGHIRLRDSAVNLLELAELGGGSLVLFAPLARIIVVVSIRSQLQLVRIGIDGVGGRGRVVYIIVFD